MFVVVVAGGALLLVAVLVQRYARLSNIPGPPLAAVSDIWRWIAMNKPCHGERMVALHRKYGPLVRIGPNQVSVGDPAAVQIIYTTKPVWQKGPSYSPGTPVSNGKPKPSILTMTDSQHAAVRKVSGAAFTANALLDYEDYIDETCLELMEAISKQPDHINLVRWFQFFAMDVINRIAFSDSLGFIKNGHDVDGLMAAVMHRFDYWNEWAAMPSIENLLMKGFLSRIRPSRNSPLAAVGKSKMAKRAESGRSGDLKDLLDKFLDGKAKHEGLVSEDEVLGMIMSTIGAGADTSSATLAIIFYFLGRNPSVVENLRQELRQQSLSDPPKWNEVQQLPYLDAVIREAMRVLPMAGWGMDRIVPPGGVEICGFFLPEGTIVGSQIDAVQRNEEYYGEDPDDYRPERWLDASEEQKKRMDRAFLAFGSGRRICLGMHIAWLELKKLLPFLVMRLDITLVEPEMPLTEHIKPSSIRYLPPIYATAKLRN